MNEDRLYASAAMFEGDDSIWWITGGWNGDSTETYNALDDSFVPGPDLPKYMYYHNLVNVNNTHMVVLGGQSTTDETFIFDRLLLFK